MRSYYSAYGRGVRNSFRSLHTKDPADALHPESRASCRQDGVKASRFYSLSAPSCIATRAVAQEQEGRHRVRRLEPVPFSTSCERNETSVSECEYTPHPCMHAQSRRETSTHARDSRVQTSRLKAKSPNPSSTRKGSSYLRVRMGNIGVLMTVLLELSLVASKGYTRRTQLSTMGTSQES